MEPRRDWFEMVFEEEQERSEMEARERDAEVRRRRAAEAALRRIARQAAEEAAEAMAMARAAEDMRQRTAEAAALRQARRMVEQERNARMEQQRRAREEEEAEKALLSPGSDAGEANSASTASLEPLVAASRNRWTLEDGMLVEVGDPAPTCDVAFNRPRIATAQIP